MLISPLRTFQSWEPNSSKLYSAREATYAGDARIFGNFEEDAVAFVEVFEVFEESGRHWRSWCGI